MKVALPVAIDRVLATSRSTLGKISYAGHYAVKPVTRLAESQPDHTRHPTKPRGKSSDEVVDAVRFDRLKLAGSGTRDESHLLKSAPGIPVRLQSHAAIRASTTRCASSDRSLVEIRPGGSKTALFCVHAAAGHLRLYDNLARHLDPERPVYGLRGVARAAHCPLRQLAERYVVEIREFQPTGPYIIVGECDGGALAFEIAQQLRAVCEHPPLLVLLDSFAPGWPRPRPFVPRAAYRAVDFARLLGFHLRVLAALDRGAKWEYLAPRIVRPLRRVGIRFHLYRGAVAAELTGPRAFREARLEYVALPYDGRGVLVHGKKLPWGITPGSALGWSNLLTDLAVSEVPTYFGTNLLEPNVGMLAEHMERVIDAD